MAQALCPCGCNKIRSRKTINRHLNGIGTQAVRVAQENKIVDALRRRRLRVRRVARQCHQENHENPPTSQDIDAHHLNANESSNVPINSLENVRLNVTPPPEAMNVDVPIAFPVDDASHNPHYPHDDHPLGRINESLYEESGIWRFRWTIICEADRC